MLLDSIFMTVVTVYLMDNTIDWKLTLLALLPMPFLAGPWPAGWAKMIHGRFRAVQRSFRPHRPGSGKTLSGIRVIKSFVQEEAEIQRFGPGGQGLRSQEYANDQGLGA